MYQQMLHPLDQKAKFMKPKFIIIPFPTYQALAKRNLLGLGDPS